MSIQTQAHPSSQRSLIIIWILYFFQFGAVGVFFPFLYIYYQQNGLSGTELGLLTTAGALVSVFGSSLWGYLSDHVRQPRLLIAGGALGAALVVQAIPWVHGFGGYLLVGLLLNLISAGISPMIDSLTLTMLGDQREEYGRYRLGGSVGFILATAIAGGLYDRIGLQWIFGLYLAFTAGFSLTALFLPPSAVHLSPGSRAEIGRMVRQPVWLVFAGSIFLVWITSMGIISFMGVALKSMGANQGLVGLAASIGALVEIPFMLFSGRWMRKYGATTLLWISMLAFAIRCALYGIMPVPEWAIWIGMLNGPSYVFFWSSAVNYARTLAPEGLGATAQGLLVSVTSLASMATGLFAGLLFDQMGAHGMFWVLAACSMAGFLLFRLAGLRRQTGLT